MCVCVCVCLCVSVCVRMCIYVCLCPLDHSTSLKLNVLPLSIHCKTATLANGRMAREMGLEHFIMQGRTQIGEHQVASQSNP